MVKKVLSAVLVMTCCLGLFAGCQNTEVETDVTGESSTISVDDEYSSELNLRNDDSDKETAEKRVTEANTKSPVSPQNEEKSTTKKETSPADIKTPEEPQAPETPQTPKPSTSYQAIFDTYSAKIKAATPGIVQEYIDESAGISDITTLAELSNAKIQKLAEISNDGIGEMAQLMYDTNGSYDEYESWAGKLTDVYMEEAAKISDAYMDSVM